MPYVRNVLFCMDCSPCSHLDLVQGQNSTIGARRLPLTQSPSLPLSRSPVLVLRRKEGG